MILCATLGQKAQEQFTLLSRFGTKSLEFWSDIGGNGVARKKIDTLIIDLDNTIYDWFAIWYATFKPIYDEISKVSGLSVDDVNKAIRKVHQERRTSEYTFLLEEICILDEMRNSRNIRELFHNAITASHEERDRKLQLYPGVFRTLWAAKEAGVRIVAYTESMSFYSAYRLKRLGLDGVIDVLFSPQDHDMPKGISVTKFRSLPDQFYELQVTEIRHTPPGELKPNPALLLDIIKSVGAEISKCAYVGDSLFKDVAMARQAGVLDIHARYGEAQRLPEYDLLRSVSHWTDTDVAREKSIVENGADFIPTVVLHENFSEIFEYCEFVSSERENSRELKAEDELKNAIEIWKKCVDVQQHFNDLSMRIRNFAITVVGALVATVSFTYQYGLQLNVWGITLPAGIGVVVAALASWLAFYMMDAHWYHVLLKGAVIHSGKIEAMYAGRLPGIGLGETISKSSGEVTHFGFKMNSTRRLKAFYFIGGIMLAILFVVLLLSKPNPVLRVAPAGAAVTTTTAPSTK